MQSLIAFPRPIEEDMRLRKEHEQLIRTEIERQISEVVDSFRPHGWTKVTHFLREWGLVATAVVVPLTLLGILITVVIFATNGITRNAEFRTHTEDRLTSIEGSLVKINSTLDGMKLKQIGSNPANPESITEAKKVLIAAASAKTKIDPGIIKDVGGKFVDAAGKVPAAWNTALAFVNYKSFLDSLRGSSPIPPDAKLVTIEETNYFVPTANYFGNKPAVAEYGASKAPDIPQLRNLTAPDLNAKVAIGPSFLVMQGGAILLDGLYIKRVVFRNTRVVYRGGPTTLNNVSFIDCTFEIVPQRNGYEFADIFLQSEAGTNFGAT